MLRYVKFERHVICRRLCLCGFLDHVELILLTSLNGVILFFFVSFENNLTLVMLLLIEFYFSSIVFFLNS